MSETFLNAIVLFVFFGIPGIAGGWLAWTKGRNMLFWALVCTLMPPTVMVSWYQKPLREVRGHYRFCPACKEIQSWKHATCKYCGAEMEQQGCAPT